MTGVHIGIVHVVALDVLEDFAIDGERAVGFVVVGAAEHVAHCDESEYDRRQHNDNVTSERAHARSFSRPCEIEVAR